MDGKSSKAIIGQRSVAYSQWIGYRLGLDINAQSMLRVLTAWDYAGSFLAESSGGATGEVSLAEAVVVSLRILILNQANRMDIKGLR